MMNREAILTKIKILDNNRDSLIHYARMKIDQEDWHAVADAMMDLRELDAKLQTLRERENE